MILSDKNTAFSKTLHLSYKGLTLNKSGPVVMGILNLTPDSFYDGGRYLQHKQYLEQAEKMLNEGAHILDLGAYSTRPGAQQVKEDEEAKRLFPALEQLVRHFPEALFSVDTFRQGIASGALQRGAMMINDISGGSFDANMIDFIGRQNIPYVLMHTTGKPDRMMEHPLAENALAVVKDFFNTQLMKLQKKGATQLVLDPGFGFGKSLEANYALLKHLPSFADFGYPVLVGLSRKSMVNKVLGTKPENALNGSTVLHTLAIMQGAGILRVHDVKETVEAIRICRAFLQ